MKVVMRNGSGTRDYKFVVTDYDRHGNLRTYLRRRGRKVRLREIVGTPEFDAEYHAALEGGPQAPESHRKVPVSSGSLRWLVEHYYVSADFTGLNELTQKRRRVALDDICEEHGSKPFRKLEAKHVQLLIRDAMADTPVAANNRIKELRQVFKWAISVGHAVINPTRDIERLKPKNSDGYHHWTTEEVEQFMAFYPVRTKGRLLLDIMLYAGGPRCSDAYRLGKQHISKPTEDDPNGRIKYKQFKGRGDKNPVHIDIPVVQCLQDTIDASPCGDMAFLVSNTGRPFASAASFGNWVKKLTKAAGIPHCSAHGLRKASACKLAELGLTDLQIMAWNGWKNLKQVQEYTRGMNRKVMADAGALKIEEGYKSNKSVPLSSDGDGSGTNKAIKA